MASMAAPTSIAPGHWPSAIIQMTSGMPARTSSSSIHRPTRIIVCGSEWMNQSINFAAVASTERPSTTALMITA